MGHLEPGKQGKKGNLFSERGVHTKDEVAYRLPLLSQSGPSCRSPTRPSCLLTRPVALEWSLFSYFVQCLQKFLHWLVGPCQPTFVGSMSWEPRWSLSKCELVSPKVQYWMIFPCHDRCMFWLLQPFVKMETSSVSHRWHQQPTNEFFFIRGSWQPKTWWPSTWKKKRQWFCQGEPVLDLGNIDLVIYTPPPLLTLLL